MAERPCIFIDGENVAKAHGKHAKFSFLGVLKCAQYFKKFNHPVKIILRSGWQARAEKGQIEHGDELLKLYQHDFVVFTPNNLSDDEFLIARACEKRGIIVSNDQYRKEAEKAPKWKSFLLNRILPYSFDGDDFLPAPFPLGDKGPPLDEFLTTFFQEKVESVSDITDFLINSTATSLDNTSQTSAKANPVSKNKNVSKSRENPQECPAPVRHSSSSDSSKTSTEIRRYGVGTVINIKDTEGQIRFEVNRKLQQMNCKFDIMAYNAGATKTFQPLIPALDLRNIFHVGDSAGFVSDFSNGKWIVCDVRPISELYQGYGYFDRLIEQDKSATIKPQVPEDVGGKNVFFPGAAFREAEKLRDLSTDSRIWLYFYAFAQPTSNGCSAVAAQVVYARISGVVVKQTGFSATIWSPKVGSATLNEKNNLKLGDWVNFRILSQFSENSESRWIAKDPKSVGGNVSITITSNPADGNLTIFAELKSIAGVICSSFGSVYTEELGRIELTPECAKEIYKKGPKFGSEMVVRCRYERRSDVKDFSWRVVNVLQIRQLPPPVSAQSPSLKHVKATVARWKLEDRKLTTGFLRTEHNDRIFVRFVDVIGDVNRISEGDTVAAIIYPQTIDRSEYRTLIVDRLQSSNVQRQMSATSGSVVTPRKLKAIQVITATEIPDDVSVTESETSTFTSASQRTRPKHQNRKPRASRGQTPSNKNGKQSVAAQNNLPKPPKRREPKEQKQNVKLPAASSSLVMDTQPLAVPGGSKSDPQTVSYVTTPGDVFVDTAVEATSVLVDNLVKKNKVVEWLRRLGM